MTATARPVPGRPWPPRPGPPTREPASAGFFAPSSLPGSRFHFGKYYQGAGRRARAAVPGARYQVHQARAAGTGLPGRRARAAGPGPRRPPPGPGAPKGRGHFWPRSLLRRPSPCFCHTNTHENLDPSHQNTPPCLQKRKHGLIYKKFKTWSMFHVKQHMSDLFYKATGPRYHSHVEWPHAHTRTSQRPVGAPTGWTPA
jgi:hypothetical protein